MALTRCHFVLLLCSSILLLGGFQPVLAGNLAYNLTISADFDVQYGKDNLKTAVDEKPGSCFLETQGENAGTQPVTVEISGTSPADVITVVLYEEFLESGQYANQPEVTVHKEGGDTEILLPYRDNSNAMFLTYRLPTPAQVTQVQVRGQHAPLALCEISVLAVCQPGKRGMGCDQDCIPACVDKVCDRLTARCTKGCDKSVVDRPECRKNCEEGFYGKNCDKPCSANCLGDVCDVNSGHCRHGCVQGMTGDFCDTRTNSGEGMRASLLLATAAVVSTILQYS